ncbi:restriction endonuclease subunit S [Aeromonas enteropelogenes]|uniref:restriction endonuclease subunit S n=1 Tax=Aeromonas enteropelogenes TaxID=29489 RepID=UPI00398703EA
MRSEWPEVRLGDHVDACLGKMLDVKKNKGTPEPYLGNSNVRWGTFDLVNLAEMRFEPHEEERYGLLSGDLIVCEGGEPGRCAIWTGTNSPRMKIQKALHRIRPKGNLNNYFLYYWFCYAAKAGLLEQHFTGTTIKHLTGKAIAALKIPLPPIEFQVALVDVLKTLDDCIALLRETNATLEAIVQALFKSWFVDFDPVHARARGEQPAGLTPEVAALFPDSFEESDLGQVPKGWSTGSLNDLALLNPESWTVKNRPDSVAYVDLANAKENEIAEITEFLFEDAPSRARRVLRDGDTIVGTVRPGNRSYAFISNPRPNLTGSTGFAVLRPKQKAATEYVYLAATANSSIEYLAHVADGGAYPAVRPEVVSNLPCVLPSYDVLNAFHAVAAPLFAKVAANHQQAQTLANLRDTLLPRLISGQLRLPDAEEQLSEAGLCQ